MEKAPTHYTPWWPLGLEMRERLPVAVIGAGRTIAPGQIHLHDVLLLPNAAAEVTQVVGIIDGGTEGETWDLRALPDAGATPWRLTLKVVNGAPVVGTPGAITPAIEYRPVIVVRVGQVVESRAMVAFLHSPSSPASPAKTSKGIELVRMNGGRGLARLTAVGSPLNSPLAVLASRLPAEPEVPQERTEVEQVPPQVLVEKREE